MIGKSIPKLKTEIISPEVPKNAGKVFRKSKTKPTTSSLKDDAREVAEADGSKDDQDEEVPETFLIRLMMWFYCSTFHSIRHR